MMLRESIRLERLINDMLDLSRLQSGNAALQKAKIDTASIFYNIIADYKIIADEMDVNFICKINIKDIPIAYSNADRITQVLIILLDNAIKYTPCGGTVTLDADFNDEMIKIMVIDTGEGIANEDVPFVFERFYKADKSHSSKGIQLYLRNITNMVILLINGH